jgi:hypothetical protein
MDADELYGLPLDRFVPERDALARGLRTSGRREDAAAVARLRKPSVAAWAVNQLVRTQRRAVAELFEAGDALRDAHQSVVSGAADGHALRAATERERAAVESLVGAAHGLLTSEGQELSAAIIERVSDTLHAAALDDDARAAVAPGTLERELRHVGLGAISAAASPRGSSRRPPAVKPATETRQRSAADVKAREAERARARKAARAAVAEARRRHERAERALRVAQERRDHAAQALHDADAALAASQAEADAAAAAYEQARGTLAEGP